MSNHRGRLLPWAIRSPATRDLWMGKKLTPQRISDHASSCEFPGGASPCWNVVTRAACGQQKSREPRTQFFVVMGVHDSSADSAAGKVPIPMFAVLRRVSTIPMDIRFSSVSALARKLPRVTKTKLLRTCN
jgi:hypothetical protein